MESTGITPVMNVGGGYGYGDGFGSYIWLFAILALMNGGFGGFGGSRANFATTEDLASGFNFSGVNNKLNEITAGIAGVNQNLGNAICTSTYELASKIDKCCCDTQRAVDGVKFDMANYASVINANTTAGVQKVLDAIAQNKIESLQSQVSQLQLNQALCGVVRYPTSATYNAGYPFYYGYNCGCNTNI